MERVDIPYTENGIYKIEKFTVEHTDFHSLFLGRNVPVGETFTRLKRGSIVVMSDTPAEMRDHIFALHKATGSCLINGLGIGMLLKNILLKPDVTDVTVIEISREVIEMVGPHYNDERVTIIHANALEYKSPKGKRYQMVWHDIWDYISADNLPEMHKLHRKYGKKADWQGSWCRAQCEYEQDRYKNSSLW